MTRQQRERQTERAVPFYDKPILNNKGTPTMVTVPEERSSRIRSPLNIVAVDGFQAMKLGRLGV